MQPSTLKSVVTAHPDEEAVYLEQEIQAAVQSEYIFIGLGITAVVIAFILHTNSRKHPELKIDLPSFKS